MEARTHLKDWLQDAHGMEMKALEILERQEGRLNAYPAMQQRVREHASETRRQASRLKECLARYDGETSTSRDFAGKVMGNVAALGNAMASDEPVKNAIADYAFENFEIACYRSLIAAAESVGDQQTADVCREILREEEAMASFLADHIPSVTKSFLQEESPTV